MQSESNSHDIARLQFLQQQQHELLLESEELDTEIATIENTRKYNLTYYTSLSQQCGELEAHTDIIKRSKHNLETEIERLENVVHDFDAKIFTLQNNLRVLQNQHTDVQLDHIRNFQQFELDLNPDKLTRKIEAYTAQINDAKQLWQYSQSSDGQQEIQRISNELQTFEITAKEMQTKLQGVKHDTKVYQNVYDWLKTQRFFSWNLHLMGFYIKDAELYAKLGREIARTPSLFIENQNQLIFPSRTSLPPSLTTPTIGNSTIANTTKPYYQHYQLRELYSLLHSLSPMNTVLAMLRPWAFFQTNILGDDVLGKLSNTSEITDLKLGLCSDPNLPITSKRSSSMRKTMSTTLPSEASLYTTPWGFSIDMNGTLLDGNSPRNKQIKPSNDSTKLNLFNDPAICGNPEHNFVLNHQSCFNIDYSIYKAFRTLYDIQAELQPLDQYSTELTSSDSSQSESNTIISNPELLPRLLAYMFTLYSNDNNIAILRAAMEQFLQEIPTLQRYHLLPINGFTDNSSSFGENNDQLCQLYEIFFMKALNWIQGFVAIISSDYVLGCEHVSSNTSSLGKNKPVSDPYQHGDVMMMENLEDMGLTNDTQIIQIVPTEVATISTNNLNDEFSQDSDQVFDQDQEGSGNGWLSESNLNLTLPPHQSGRNFYQQQYLPQNQSQYQSPQQNYQSNSKPIKTKEDPFSPSNHDF